jgi:hypothetical protein
MSSFPPPPPFPRLDYLASLGRRRYVLLSFYFGTTPSLEASHYIQPVINRADDWLKYADNCWIVWSAKTPDQWYAELTQIEQVKAFSIFILYVDVSGSNRAGQLPPWAWEWIDKPRL